MQREFDDINHALEDQGKVEHRYNLTNIDLDTSITKMQAERNRLLIQFENITIDFDHYVRDICVKTERLNNKNRMSIQNMVANIIFRRIRKMQLDRREAAFKKMNAYSQFDAECYSKLKAFRYVMYRLGQYKKQTALDKWYNHTLKPYGTIG